MPRKKTKTLTGIGSRPEHSLVVQKSNPMTVLARSELSLAELKILDMYLARINTHNPEHRTIKLTKGQLEEALGVTQLKKADLKQRLKNLYQPLDLAKEDKKRLHLVSLFEEAEAEQDDDGIWQITLTCTQSAMKYIFMIEDYGYFKYKLRNVASLKSRYSLLMYLYLEKNRFRKVWTEDIDVLRHELNCENDEFYNEFKVFNQRILKRCQSELCKKTDRNYTYEPIKKGRKVVSIKFELETIKDLIAQAQDNSQIEGQMTVEELLGDNPRDLICTGFSHPDFEQFSSEQLEALKELAWSKKSDEDYERHMHLLNDALLASEHACADYLRRKVAQAKVYKPENLYMYLKKIIEND